MQLIHGCKDKLFKFIIRYTINLLIQLERDSFMYLLFQEYVRLHTDYFVLTYFVHSVCIFKSVPAKQQIESIHTLKLLANK